MNNISKACLVCSKPITGRTDKKFCDDYCRNAYNNRVKTTLTVTINTINRELRKNRKALAGLLPANQENIKVSKNKLLELGFKFRWITDQHLTGQGKRYYFCYDYGYLDIGKGWYLIVRQKEF